MNNSVSNRKKIVLHKSAGVLVSLSILSVLYVKSDLAALRDVFGRINYAYVAPLIISFVLIYILVAWRWQILTRPFRRFSFASVMKMVLSSSSLNIVLPSKLGSFAKAYFISSSGRVETKTAISMAIYEKFSDLGAMSVIFVFAALINGNYRLPVFFTFFLSIVIIAIFVSLHTVNILDNALFRRWRTYRWFDRAVSWSEVIYRYQKSQIVTKQELIQSAGITLLLWVVHTIQLVLFFYLLNFHLPVHTIATYMICAIFAGLVPFTVAGIGTRDLAIVYLFNGTLTYNEALGIGILSTLRYIVPTIFGLPLLVRMMFSKKTHQTDKP